MTTRHEPLIFQFKTKVAKDGAFSIPDLKPIHARGIYNELTLAVHYRKRKTSTGNVLPRPKQNVNTLPAGLTIEESGFLTTFTLSI